MTVLAEAPAQATAVPARARPGYVLLTVIAWVFVAIGWIFGALWRAVVFCARSVRYGYWRGLGLTDEDIAARLAEPAPASQESPRPSRL